MSDVKLLIISGIASVTLMFSVFLFEDRVVSKLDNNNRFKKWWRRNLIGEMKEPD